MAERPTRRPRFGYDAPSGRMLEPLAGVAAAGFAPGQRPPAEWINYLLHFTTAWCDYLSGPGWGAWGRTTHGGSAPVFTAVAGLAVDADDTRAAGGRYRYILAGTKAGPTPILAVSRTGREWVKRSAPSAMTVMSGCAVVGDRVLCWGTSTGPSYKLWYTDPDTPSVASAISADDATQWVEATDLAGDLVKGLAWNGAGEAWCVAGSSPDTIYLARSTDDGETWPYAIGFDPGVTSGAINTDIAWDETRGRYLIATDEGDVIAWDPNALVGTALDVLSGIATTASVRLRAGGGTCLAWASVDRAGSALGASQLWRSDDGGETWAAVTLPSAIGATLTDVAYADGVWVATTTAAPYLWRSDDAGATWERVQLPLDESSSWALHRAVYADGAVTASGLTWTVATTRATGLAPDATRVYSPEPGYLADAGYLRGRRIAATAPTDGQVLVWDATGGLWVPETAAGGDVPDVVAVDLSSGTGWTQSAGPGASAMVDTGAESIVCTVPSGGGPPNLYALQSRAVAPGDALWVDLRVRIRGWDDGGSPRTNDIGDVMLITGAVFAGARVRGDGTVLARTDAGAGTPVAVSGILGGQGWLRVVLLGSTVVIYAGVGTGGAQPTTWTPIGSARLSAAVNPPLTTLRVDAERTSAGGAPLVVTWGDISMRAGGAT